MHKRATPVAGGIALFISTCLAFVVGMAVAPESVRDEFSEQGMPFLGLLIAALVMCSVGILDDCGLLRGRHKLIGQVVAILIVIAFGVSIQRIQIFEWEIDLGLLAVPFTVFLLLGAVNSLNLLDGLDGVLGCVALIIVSAMAALAVLGNHWPAALVAAAVAGSLLGFLRYNFPPASIFLGDCGSMLIGLVVGVLAIRTSLKGPATVALAAPLAALTIPILDTTAAVVRRRLTGRSLYSSDRGHLHHCLLHQGFSIRGVLFWISFFCLFTVLGALVSVALRNELVAIVTAVAVVGILIGMRLFGHSEFILARDRLVATANSFMQFRPNGKPHATEVHLQGSVPWREIWSRFTACADDLNLKSIRLDLNAPFYSRELSRPLELPRRGVRASQSLVCRNAIDGARPGRGPAGNRRPSRRHAGLEQDGEAHETGGTRRDDRVGPRCGSQWNCKPPRADQGGRAGQRHNPLGPCQPPVGAGMSLHALIQARYTGEG